MIYYIVSFIRIFVLMYYIKHIIYLIKERLYYLFDFVYYHGKLCNDCGNTHAMECHSPNIDQLS